MALLQARTKNIYICMLKKGQTLPQVPRKSRTEVRTPRRRATLPVSEVEALFSIKTTTAIKAALAVRALRMATTKSCTTSGTRKPEYQVGQEAARCSEADGSSTSCSSSRCCYRYHRLGTR